MDSVDSGVGSCAARSTHHTGWGQASPSWLGALDKLRQGWCMPRWALAVSSADCWHHLLLGLHWGPAAGGCLTSLTPNQEVRKATSRMEHPRMAQAGPLFHVPQPSSESPWASGSSHSHFPHFSGQEGPTGMATCSQPQQQLRHLPTS